MIKKPIEVLATVFGYSQFRGNQAAIVDHVVAGNHAFVLMPTGGGKSLCYQIPALIRDGTTIVVSPLIALMQDQVDTLRQLGVKAAFLNSSLNVLEARNVERDLIMGQLDLLYVAPERLLTPGFLRILEKINLSLFAIDEAHCVSQWGHDFRPEYTQLSILHEKFPNVPRLALTATADERTRGDIKKYLYLDSAKVFISSFNRQNLCYRIVLKNNAKNQLLKFIREEHPQDAGIVYCLSRKKVEEIALFLQNEGLDAKPYHAGLSSEIRHKTQQHFIREEGSIIVATVAFGMGIDKPNVRFVAHLDLPKSLEGYYQETGRGGRDGLPADAWLAYGLSDVINLKQMLSQSMADEQFKRAEKRKLESLLGFCETTLCRREALLHYFGENYQGPCQNCDNCMSEVETIDGLVAAQMALSCVYRTGQRFGVKHLIDILLGKKTEQVDRFRHYQLSTFGIGHHFTQVQWNSIFRQLIAANLLTVDFNGYGNLLLTEKSIAILKGHETILLRKESLSKAQNKVKKIKVKTTALPKVNDPLWTALKQTRLELAKAQGVPPYVIFHDSSLSELHEKKPQTLVKFAEINGVGQSKLAKYGEIFIKVIKNHI